MRSNFLLFNTPIDLAHSFWRDILEENDLVIDATCGNGKDSLFLAQILTPLKGTLFCIDIQERAVENTRKLLENELPTLSNIHFFKQSHESLPMIPPNLKLKLIVFNLGYLPSGDKSITTEVSSTLLSVSNALEVLAPGGLISITCYPGHAEGKKEQESLLTFLKDLDPLTWCFTTFFWSNRNASPSLFLVQKKSGI
jgi:SAM-dependent methyltransferase